MVAEGATILADGVLSVRWQGTCRRCLAEVGGLLTVPVHEMYRSQADDDLIYPITGGSIDLEPLIRDALLTSLPLAPLCAEDCKGLCSGCGADLNQDSCTCKRPSCPVPDRRNR
ncbi:MAG: YceD family protein [Acidimicrobiales bacterium]